MEGWMEEWLCSCGQVQTEHHVVSECTKTSHIRQQYNLSTFENLMLWERNLGTVWNIAHRILGEFL